MPWPLIPVIIDDPDNGGSEPGNYADAIRHSPCLNVSEYPASPVAAQAPSRRQGEVPPSVSCALPAAFSASPHEARSSHG